ncbi:Nudix-type nucleoside diphosphatase, YffH/AdpP family [Tenacibaculum maritimum]|nr:Nudix-type nucleoside diphosphatase, YffH/AdpP family [Tenacibaculum maritimum]CAA0178151.1 Nudix-type nucleoside diphosphatase, YffH/AdpP family [Tenacibaculum maritimum]CAA0178626.1 Nudix-type nucleoside diphosphatase, YffH/AdpP family [Tenacibaculum maritimum]
MIKDTLGVSNFSKNSFITKLILHTSIIINIKKTYFRMENNRVKNIRKELLSDDWYVLNKLTFDYQLTDKTWVTQSRECYDRGNGAVILLYNKKKKTVVLIKQFRMPTYINGNKRGYLIEACAGSLDGDNEKDCIIKETEEETGYRIKKVEKILELYSSPGSVTEMLYYFIGEYTDDMKVSKGGGLVSEAEDIEVLEIPFEEALRMVATGEIKDAKTIILLQYAKINNLIECKN